MPPVPPPWIRPWSAHAYIVGTVNAQMVMAYKVRADHLCCHKWSGRTTCAYITGPPGPPMPVHEWSGLNINGPPSVCHACNR